MAWARKYFIVASVSWFEEGDSIIGRKERRFNSSPIHIIIHLFDEIVIIVPSINVEEKSKRCKDVESIKDEGSWTFQFIVRSYIVHRVFLIFVSLRNPLVIHGEAL